jgi:hypothetical protein
MPGSLSPTAAAAAVDEPERASFEAWLGRQDSDFAQVKQAARAVTTQVDRYHHPLESFIDQPSGGLTGPIAAEVKTPSAA